MFTGIVSGLGEVLEVEEKAEGLRRLDIACNYDPDGIDIGASIACSGICLTVVGRGPAPSIPLPLAAEGYGGAHSRWMPRPKPCG